MNKIAKALRTGCIILPDGHNETDRRLTNELMRAGADEIERIDKALVEAKEALDNAQ